MQKKEANSLHEENTDLVYGTNYQAFCSDVDMRYHNNVSSKEGSMNQDQYFFEEK